MNYQDHLFVGVDTHKNQHTAVVINCFHKKLETVETPNNPSDFKDFVSELQSYQRAK